MLIFFRSTSELNAFLNARSMGAYKGFAGVLNENTAAKDLEHV